MRVQMNTQIGGYRNGEPWPLKGGTIDLPDHEAADLIANGYAAALEEDHAGPDEATAEHTGEPETTPEQGDPAGTADTREPEAGTGNENAPEDTAAAVKPAARRVSKKA